MLAFTIYIVGVIGAMYFFLSMADKGEEIFAIGTAILWPLVIVAGICLIVSEEIKSRRIK